jgi:hypothetical protein
MYGIMLLHSDAKNKKIPTLSAIVPISYSKEHHLSTYIKSKMLPSAVHTGSSNGKKVSLISNEITISG